jgi:uncharacterized protein
MKVKKIVNRLTCLGILDMHASEMAIDWKQALQHLKIFQDHTLAMQSLDRQIISLQDRRVELQAKLDAAKAAVGEKNEEKLAAEKERRGLEGEIETLKVHTQERETKLYAIKTNKEYQAALKEVADAKRNVREQEDKVLKLMEVGDAADQEITQLSATLSDIETDSTKALGELDTEEQGLTAAKAKEESEQAQVAASIPPEALEIYRTTQRRFPDALADVQGGICTGCNMKVPPQRFVEIRKHTRLFDCPSCHRILYVVEDDAEASNGAE